MYIYNKIILFLILFLIFLIFYLFFYTDKLNYNLIIIISKKVTIPMYEKYKKELGSDIIFISDEKPEIKRNNIFFYKTKDVINSGFTNMHSKYLCTSWDKSLYHISLNNKYNSKPLKF